MDLIDFAREYVETRNLQGKTPIYSATRFVTLVGQRDPARITADDFAQYRQACLAAGLANKTIESSLGNLCTLIRAATGSYIDVGPRLRVGPPVPKPVPIDSIDALWPHSPSWLQLWIATTYWTGLRLADSIRLLATLAGSATLGESLHLKASKTGKLHCWPLPQWLAKLLKTERFSLRSPTDAAKRRVRLSIAMACERANVPIWTPKQLRQRSINEWSRANSTAGGYIQGCRLGVLDYYLDPLTCLEGAAPKVRLPRCLQQTCVQEDAECTLLNHFRRLDPAAQLLIAGTAERLAAG